MGSGGHEVGNGRIPLHRLLDKFIVYQQLVTPGALAQVEGVQTGRGEVDAHMAGRAITSADARPIGIRFGHSRQGNLIGNRRGVANGRQAYTRIGRQVQRTPGGLQTKQFQAVQHRSAAILHLDQQRIGGRAINRHGHIHRRSLPQVNGQPFFSKVIGRAAQVAARFFVGQAVGSGSNGRNAQVPIGSDRRILPEGKVVQAGGHKVRDAGIAFRRFLDVVVAIECKQELVTAVHHARRKRIQPILRENEPDVAFGPGGRSQTIPGIRGRRQMVKHQRNRGAGRAVIRQVDDVFTRECARAPNRFAVQRAVIPDNSAAAIGNRQVDIRADDGQGKVEVQRAAGDGILRGDRFARSQRAIKHKEGIAGRSRMNGRRPVGGRIGRVLQHIHLVQASRNFDVIAYIRAGLRGAGRGHRVV